MSNKQTSISEDAANKQIIVVREFDAPVGEVWKAWTEKDILDEWWAPKPWRAKTKTLDFREGGLWLYNMIGPDGTEAYCRVDFKTISPNTSFTAEDVFCDENGNRNNQMPGMHWKNQFSRTDSGTRLKVEITFDTETEMKKIIEMGFKEGFTMGLGNLDELLQKQLYETEVHA